MVPFVVPSRFLPDLDLAISVLPPLLPADIAGDVVGPAWEEDALSVLGLVVVLAKAAVIAEMMAASN